MGGRPARATRSRRPELEGLEGRVVLSVTIAATNNSGHGYAALDFNQSGGFTPPDTSGAAGPSAYVETVNQAVALYGSKASGTPAVTSSLSNFWFTTGGLAHADGGSGLSDPITAYDDQIGRFIIGDQDVNGTTHVSTFDIAVSKTSSPTTLGTSDWNFYRISTTETGYDADYPGNFGYNHDAFVFTMNMFGTSNHAMVVSVSHADLAAGVAQASLNVYRNDVSDFSLRPTTMHDSVAGDPMWLLSEHGDGKSIDVIKQTGVLSNAATIAYTNLPVAAYSTAVHPINPNGTTVTTNMDSRIQKAAEWNKVVVASHSVSVGTAEDDAQWYAVDVSGASPVLKDQGRVGGGANTYTTFPGIDINASGQIGMTYARSGNDTSTDYLSMYVTGRNPGDPAGTMEAAALVPAGAGQANYKDFTAGGRCGDLSGINVDPTDGSFWASNEFANTEASANWGTAVANFTLTSPLPPADMAVTVAGPSSVTAGTSATYTITITNSGPNAAQGVVLTDTLPAGSSFGSWTKTSGTDTFTLAQSGGSATATATADIAGGGSDTFTLVVSAPSGLGNGASFNDTASVRANNPDPNTANNTSTATGSVVNSNPNADLSVGVSGPATANEGDTVQYTITVTNAGPAAATGVTLTDNLPGLVNYISATTGQGTFAVSGGTVTFSMGTIAAGATVTATVTGRAIEDGSGSDTATATASSADPNTANNSASATTSFAEPPIVVSGAIATKSSTLTNYQTATFTHANGVEPIGAFIATINWGDGTTSTGTITQSGSTYTVTGSHTYTSGGRHTITTTVKEAGNSVAKFGDTSDGGSWKHQDVVRLPGASAGRIAGSPDAGPSAPSGGSATSKGFVLIGPAASVPGGIPSPVPAGSSTDAPAAGLRPVPTTRPVASASHSGTVGANLGLYAIPQGGSAPDSQGTGLEPTSPGNAGRRRPVRLPI